MKIKRPCDSEMSPGSSGCAGIWGFYKIMIPVPGEKSNRIERGHYPSRCELWPNPQIRQTLYSFESCRPSALTPTCRRWARCTAQEMMRWLLSLPVTIGNHGSQLGFSITLDAHPSTSEHMFQISDILKRDPEILCKDWGRFRSTAVYSQPLPYPRRGGRQTAHVVNPQKTPNDLLRHFPILRALVEDVSKVCRCIGCKDRIPNRPIEERCQRYSAVFEVLMLLAHGIADAFGVDNVSARRDTAKLLQGIITLVDDLVGERRMNWDVWFGVAATVLTGGPYPTQSGDADRYHGTICAIEYGNVTAIAGWLNLEDDFVKEGCFSLISGEGKLCTSAEEGMSKRCRGVLENYTVVHCAPREPRAKYHDMFPKPSEPEGNELKITVDSMAVDIDTVMISAGENVCVLLTRVRSGLQRRIIDPSDAILGFLRTTRVPQCDHARNSKRKLISDGRCSLHCFDDLLGGWSNQNCEDEESEAEDEDALKVGLTFHATHLMNTTLKLNVAYALSAYDSPFVNMDLSCLRCSINYTKAAPPLKEKENSGPDRYIINALAPARRLPISL